MRGSGRDTNDEIAADLFVSVSTVKTYARNISVKHGGRNRVEIAACAWHGHASCGKQRPGVGRHRTYRGRNYELMRACRSVI